MKEVKNLQELINREQAGKNICKYCASTAYCKEDDCMVYQGLRDTPTIQIEAEPVRHGRWIETRHNPVGDTMYCDCYCSNCNFEITREKGRYPKFCENCGARMDADHIADVSKKVGRSDKNDAD